MVTRGVKSWEEVQVNELPDNVKTSAIATITAIIIGIFSFMLSILNSSYSDIISIFPLKLSRFNK